CIITTLTSPIESYRDAFLILLPHQLISFQSLSQIQNQKSQYDQKRRRFELENVRCSLYGAAWIPSSASASASSAAMKSYVVLAGGGGEGRSGIPNALLVSEFDFASNSLADEPVAKLGTGSDLPYRISVHPQGEGLLLDFGGKIWS
ncbi:hypothetical protein Leryth_023115, partial [Lithospermum erythrorhizon]